MELLQETGRNCHGNTSFLMPCAYAWTGLQKPNSIVYGMQHGAYLGGTFTEPSLSWKCGAGNNPSAFQPFPALSASSMACMQGEAIKVRYGCLQVPAVLQTHCRPNLRYRGRYCHTTAHEDFRLLGGPCLSISRRYIKPANMTFPWYLCSQTDHSPHPDGQTHTSLSLPPPAAPRLGFRKPSKSMQRLGSVG